ncbi:hypothetical protein N781_06575 [Pontibacillus halophilus JSM 076056 = DSM 19796]|uniref:RsgI N-terminal anti-sigma domain-containing protein n=1 Tax=Pontibacillus halophilus JSM 076056 = DSM 19796 TaxID=1385510 RepID=A0A0A5GI11_9BACI|nr:hypothetical protein [Pontibacillus halophilus]KGX90760.1 hypothetical protein N781_06575 [Pontibacillus halophilus JSM 076056 = DSM 19796]
MKKGIVMELGKSHMVVMSQSGTFYKAERYAHVDVGEEVSFQPIERPLIRTGTSLFRTMARVAAVMLVFFVALIPFWIYPKEAYAYVNIEMNPSIELELNKDMNVIGLSALNEEGRKVIQKLSNWKGSSVAEVAERLIRESHNQGYIGDGSNVMIGVSYSASEEEDASFTASIDEQIDRQFDSLTVATFEVPTTVRDKAKKQHVSMNQLYASRYLLHERKERPMKTFSPSEWKAFQAFYHSE